MAAFELTFPDANAEADQDSEHCMVSLNGERRKIRFHDYAEIYDVAGLYEHLFYEVLDCRSPDVVSELLREQLEEGGHEFGALNVLDLGAGNGMVGERLARMGCGKVVGVDILPEAAMATERDRPGVYTEYVVCDLTDPDPAAREALGRHRFGIMTTVAALGFGDVPPEAFAYAYDLLVPGAWLAFCIKEDFLEDDEPSGFNLLIRRLIDDGEIEVFAERRYRHRMSAQGDPLHYIAMIAQKTDS